MFISSIKPTIFIFLLIFLHYNFVFGSEERTDNDITQGLTDTDIDAALYDLSLSDLNVLKQLVDAPNIDDDYNDHSFLEIKREIPSHVKDDDIYYYDENEKEDMDKSFNDADDIVKIQISENGLVENNHRLKHYRNIETPQVEEEVNQPASLVKIPLPQELLKEYYKEYERPKRMNKIQKNRKRQEQTLMSAKTNMKQQRNVEKHHHKDQTQTDNEPNFSQSFKDFVNVIGEDTKSNENKLQQNLESIKLKDQKRSYQKDKQQKKQQSLEDINDDVENHQQHSENVKLKDQNRFYRKDKQQKKQQSLEDINDDVEDHQQRSENIKLKDEKRCNRKDQLLSNYKQNTQQSFNEINDEVKEEHQQHPENVKLKNHKRFYRKHKPQSGYKQNQLQSLNEINDDEAKEQYPKRYYRSNAQYKKIKKNLEGSFNEFSNEIIEKKQEHPSLINNRLKTNNVNHIKRSEHENEYQNKLQNNFPHSSNEFHDANQKEHWHLRNENVEHLKSTQNFKGNDRKRYCRHEIERFKIKQNFKQTLDDLNNVDQGEEEKPNSSVQDDIKSQNSRTHENPRDYRQNLQSHEIKQQLEQSLKEFNDESNAEQLEQEPFINENVKRPQRLQNIKKNNEQMNDNESEYQRKIKQDITDSFDQFTKERTKEEHEYLVNQDNQQHLDNSLIKFNNEAENEQKVNSVVLHDVKVKRHKPDLNEMVPKNHKDFQNLNVDRKENMPEIPTSNKEIEYQQLKQNGIEQKETASSMNEQNSVKKRRFPQQNQQQQQLQQQMLTDTQIDYQKKYLHNKREDPKIFRLVYEPLNKINPVFEIKPEFNVLETVPNIARDYQLKSLYTDDQLSAYQQPIYHKYSNVPVHEAPSDYKSFNIPNVNKEDDIPHINTYFDDPYFLDRHEGPQHIMNNYKINDLPFTEEFIKAGNIEENQKQLNNNGDEEMRILRKIYKRNDNEKYQQAKQLPQFNKVITPIEENSLDKQNINNDRHDDFYDEYQRNKRHAGKKSQPIYVDEEYLKQLEDSFPRDQEQNKYKDMNKAHIRVKRY